MKFLFVLISSYFFISAHAQTNWRDTAKGLSIEFIDTCQKLQRQASFKTVSGTNHSMPLIVANGIVIRGNEINEKLVDTVYVIKCPQSFEKFGNLGSLGVIWLDTKQKFETVKVTEVVKTNQSFPDKSHIIFALNGYFFSDTSLLISKKAIVRVDIIKNPHIDYLETYKDITCISIWTISKKEIRQGNSIPKACRGVNVVSVQRK